MMGQTIPRRSTMARSLLLCIGVGLPRTSMAYAAPASYELQDQTSLETANIALMSVFTGAMFLAIGASLGSFLNVVVYRRPRGMNLSDPPSMCPQCRMPIARRDNIPVLSWFLLRGRCRACRMPIPFRYPAIELGIGSLFVLLLFVELLSGGANLPGGTRYHYAGVLWILWYTKWDLLGWYGVHLLLIMTLTALAGMQHDGFVPRWRPWKSSLAAPVAGFLLAAVTVLPHLHVVPFLSPVPASIAHSQWMVPIHDRWLSGWTWNLGVSFAGFLSGLAGGFGGWLTAWPVRELLNLLGLEAREQSGLLVTLPLCGLCLGWQAAVCLAVATLLVMCVVAPIVRLVLDVKVLSTDVLIVMSLLLIVSWRWVHLGWESVGGFVADNLAFHVSLCREGVL